MRIYVLIIILAVLMFFSGCGQKEKEVSVTTSPGEVYISRVIECLEHTGGLLEEISRAADAAAERADKGGQIYVTDDETIFRSGEEETKFMPGGGYNYPMHEDWGGFVAEACDRAGGLRHIQPIPLKGEISAGDIVLAGSIGLNPDVMMKQLSILKEKGVLLIAFGSHDSEIAEIADYLIDNGLEKGVISVMKIGRNKPIGPVACMANVINMWVFTSEYVAALTRLGRMPTLWQSMFVPGAAVRNVPLKDNFFHQNMKIDPVPPGTLGRQYVNTVKDYLEKIKSNELSKFSKAGMLCAETIKGGRKTVASLIGHFMTSQRRMPGFPDIFTTIENEYGSEQLDGVLEKGDVWLHVGYSYYPVRELRYASDIGAKTVCVMTPGPTDIGEGNPITPNMSLIDIYIDPYWKHGDAVVEVPGYDTKIIPPSGVIMVTCYWMLIGETMKALE